MCYKIRLLSGEAIDRFNSMTQARVDEEIGRFGGPRRHLCEHWRHGMEKATGPFSLFQAMLRSIIIVSIPSRR